MAHAFRAQFELAHPARRDFLRRLAGAGAALALDALAAPATADGQTRPIPASGERLPSIGMGSWITFNVAPNDARAREVRARVLRTFFERGGSLVDSSPMYGTSEEVIGQCLRQLGPPPRLFSATKVWTLGRALGADQMEASRKLWGLPRFDLMQIHNMLDWETHLPTLKAWKAEGRLRYIGITTSHGRRHDELAQAMAREPFDFVQFSYSLADRDAERRLLPLAADRGQAVIVNRPFDGGNLFRVVRGKPLPTWAGEIGCGNWAQFFLKFAVSHPAVSCAIPATSRVEHMAENMGALAGPLPDAALRRRMAEYFAAL